MFNRRHLSLVLAATSVISVATTAMAQTGPDLMVKQFPKGEVFEGTGDAMFLNNGHTEHAGDLQISSYDATGRVRLFPGERMDPRFGFDVSYIQLHTNDPGLPSKLVDTSVGFGIGVADYQGWLAGLSVAVGYAAAGGYDDGNAYYGKADLAIGKKLDEHSSVGIVLDYNGNRSFLPDVPLIGFEYRKQIFEKLQLAVGFPYTSVEYKPTDELTLSARYIFPDGGDASVDYAVTKYFGLFVSYTTRLQPFHDDDFANTHDRLIYEHQNAEVGLRYSPIEQVDLTAAVGYAFSQEFNVGWDTRDLDRVAKASDEPYVRFGLSMKF